MEFLASFLVNCSSRCYCSKCSTESTEDIPVTCDSKDVQANDNIANEAKDSPVKNTEPKRRKRRVIESDSEDEEIPLKETAQAEKKEDTSHCVNDKVG